MKKRTVAMLMTGMLAISSFAGMSAAAKAAEPLGVTVMGDEGTVSAAYSADVSFNNGWLFYHGDLNGAENPSYDDGGWQKINVPHDYSITQDYTTAGEAESGYKLGGTGWYRKHITIGEQWSDSRFVLTFDGAYMDTWVWVNGQRVGVNPYGYTRFSFDITDLLKFGEDNVIVAKTNAYEKTSRWYPGAGIYRDVTLKAMPKTYIEEDSLFFTTPDLSDDSVSEKSAVTTFDIVNKEQSARSVQVKTAIYERDAATGLKGALVATNGETQTVPAGGKLGIRETLRVNNPKLWSPDAPNLYILSAQILFDGEVVQTIEKEVGFRYFNFDANTGFSINGVNTKLNGVCMHHDQGALGAAAYADAVERQLVIMKEMGVNAVRVTHNPASRVMKDAANRLGIMLVEEAFDTWLYCKNYNTKDFSGWFRGTIGSENAHMLNAKIGGTWAEFELKQMVLSSRNDPSVIMWSLGNELQEGLYSGGDGSSYPAEMKKLIAWVDEIDGTRPVTTGENRLKDKYSQGRQKDYKIAVEMSDVMTYKSGLQGVVGMNYTSDLLSDEFHKEHPDWILYGSEVASSVNSRGVYKEGLNDFQLTAYDKSKVGWGSFAAEHLFVTLPRDYLAGQFVWTGFDYLGEPTGRSTWWNGIGKGAATTWPSPKNSYFGIVDTAGIPKDSYYLYQSQWNKDVTTLHVLPAWKKDIISLNNNQAEVVVYSDAYRVELIRTDMNGNRESFGSKYIEEITTPAGHTYFYNDGEGKAAVKSENLFRTWYVPYVDGKIEAIAYDREGRIISDTKGISSRSTYGAAVRVEATLYRESVKADDHALNYITIDIKDANGELVQDALNRVNVKVSGPAELVGLDNGWTTDHQSYQDDDRRVFNGQMTAIVRMTGEEGRVTVEASSDGLKSAAVSFDAVDDGKVKVTESVFYPVESTDPEPEPEPVPTEAKYIRDEVNIARDSAVTQSVDPSLWSDNLAAVNDGVQVSVPNSGGVNGQVWSNYNAAQAGQMEASVTIDFGAPQNVYEIVLFQFTDSWSAELPGEVRFTSSEASAVVNPSLISEERLSSTTVKRVYRLERPVTMKDLTITERNMDGVKRVPHCVGLSEVEIYRGQRETSFETVPAGMIEDIIVGSEEPIAKNSKWNAIDGDPSTIWHTSWSGCADDERYITIKLKDMMSVSDLHVLPRSGNKDGDNNGRIADYSVEVSQDGVNYVEISRGHWGMEEGWKNLALIAPEAKYIKLNGLTTYGNSWANKYMSVAELLLEAGR